jgi:ribosomal protein L18
MKKVPASEATRKRLEEVFSGEQIDPSRIVREATRLMIEQALEAEVEQAWVGATTPMAELQATTGRDHCATAFAEGASIAPRASSNSMPRRCVG